MISCCPARSYIRHRILKTKSAISFQKRVLSRRNKVNPLPVMKTAAVDHHLRVTASRYNYRLGLGTRAPQTFLNFYIFIFLALNSRSFWKSLSITRENNFFSLGLPEWAPHHRLTVSICTWVFGYRVHGACNPRVISPPVFDKHTFLFHPLWDFKAYPPCSWNFSSLISFIFPIFK